MNEYCSRFNSSVLVVMVLLFCMTERQLISKGYQWKQLILPGFDTIMGLK